MIAAVSCFLASNERKGAGLSTSLDPHSPSEEVKGFLGEEVFTASEDAAHLYRLTRWTDIDSFRAWQASAGQPATPKAMLSGSGSPPHFAQVLILQRLQDLKLAPKLAEFAADATPLLGRYLAASKSVYLFLVSLEGKIQTCNAAATALINGSGDQVVGKSLWDYMPEADARALRERVHGSVRRPGEQFYINMLDPLQAPHTLECFLAVRPDGFILLGEAPRMQEEALAEQMILLNNELTVATRESARKSRALTLAVADLKEAQARLVHQEKMASLGQLTAGIAHEINNPISFVSNNQSTLQRDFEDLMGLINVVGDSLEEMAERCPTIAANITRKAAEIDLTFLASAVPKKIANNLDGLERVRRIVLDLRNFSRLDEGGFKSCDVAEGIRSGLKFLSAVFEKQGVILQTDFPPLPPLVCAPGPLNQAISNVIVNAIQASQPGQTVKVSTSHENGFYVITVADEGSGITAEHMPRLFDPFFTTKPVGEGTGLGLSIANQVMKLHRGDIKVSSQLGRGATFRLRIPLVPQAVAYSVHASNEKSRP